MRCVSRAGVIPEVLGALSELEHISLPSNQLTGERRARIIQEVLLFWVPKFYSTTGGHGSITPCYTSATPPFHFSCAGPIPGALGALSKLKRLCLNFNELTGENNSRIEQVGFIKCVAPTRRHYVCLQGNE